MIYSNFNKLKKSQSKGFLIISDKIISGVFFELIIEDIDNSNSFIIK